MRNYKILNRPMFNRNNSAYGRGIASNLVSEEQRQRFNYGGRVRASNGVYIEPEIYSYDIQDAIPDIQDTTPKISSNGGSGYMDVDTTGPLYEPRQSTLDFWKGTGIYSDWDPEKRKEKAKVERAIEKDIATEGKSSQDLFWDEERRKAQLGISDKYKTGEGGIGLIEKPNIQIDDLADEGLPTDPKSDQLYTPQEQKEKKSQMALALAGRLIGGSRDKWGSKAQMENIAGGLEDIRKIADPSERRDMLAKYKAWGKARTKETLANLREQERINSSEEALLNQHIGQPLSFKVSEILKIKNVERKTPFIVTDVPDENRPGKTRKGRVIDKTKLEVGILYTDPADPNSFMVLDSQGIIQTLSSTTDIIEARDKKLIK